MLKTNGALYASAEYASIQVPTYPAGQIGAFLARKAPPDASVPCTCRSLARPIPEEMPLVYYTEEMHVAAFALPAFIKRRLDTAVEDPVRKSASKRRRLKWQE